MNQLDNLLWYCKKVYWWVQHRFNPKHQYNKINDMGLSSGYYDPDIRILHSTFTLFCEWKESVEKTVVWSENPTKWFYLCEAYDYWKYERPALLLEASGYWDACTQYEDCESILDFINDVGDPLKKLNWQIQAIKASQIEDVYIRQQDKYYLKLIIDHLELLWYP